jgi:hypothetical protein
VSTLSLRLPASLHRNLRELAEREGVSINQIISSAVGEKLAALQTLDYLRERAKRGSRKAFDAVLAKVPDVEPPDYDRLPNPRIWTPPSSKKRRVRRSAKPSR